MKFIQEEPRNQWEMYCLDAHADADHEVRLIDRFLDSLNLGLKPSTVSGTIASGLCGTIASGISGTISPV